MVKFVMKLFNWRSSLLAHCHCKFWPICLFFLRSTSKMIPNITVIVHSFAKKSFQRTISFMAIFDWRSSSLADWQCKLFVKTWTVPLFVGILLGVPIPAKEEGNCSIENSIKTAVQEAKEKNISGKEITPYILAR